MQSTKCQPSSTQPNVYSMPYVCMTPWYSLAKPRLNNVHWQKQQMEAYQRLKVPHFDKNTQLSPNEKAYLYSKISSKLSFAPRAVVYKNLIPLNVNDQMFSSRHKIQPTKSQKQKTATKKPELIMFAKPIDPLNLVIEEPKVVYQPIEIEFDYFAQYLNLE